MGKILAAITAIVAFLTKLITVKQEDSWSPEAQVRNLRIEIARLEDEKRLWQNKRLAYIRSLEPVPEQLQSKIDTIVSGISERSRQLQAIETK